MKPRGRFLMAAFASGVAFAPCAHAGSVVAAAIAPAGSDTTTVIAGGIADSAAPQSPSAGQGYPLNPFAERFRIALDQYSRDWKKLPQARIDPVGMLAEGASGPAVAALRARLGLPQGDAFDAELGSRIAEYRAVHGLPAGRQADDDLVRSLNLGPGYYFDRLWSNFARASMLPADLGRRYILVDIATQTLFMYQDGKIAGTMKVVVGKADDQTPVLVSAIDRVVLRPYWNVPPDLVRDRYAARVIAGGKNYLTTRRFEALSGWDDNPRQLAYEEVDWKAVASGKVTLRLRQRPGPGNGMGDIKFMFPNAFGVYLHDTPSVDLFAKEPRLFSAGCVRVEKPWVLADWLFGSRPLPSGDAPEQVVQLAEPVPIYLTYFSIRPQGNALQYGTDVYGLDIPGATGRRTGQAAY